MTPPLVVGVDGSQACLLAVDWAVDEAMRHGVLLRLVYASRWERYERALPAADGERPSELVLEEHIVESAAERAQRRNPDVKVITDILPDDAAVALVHESNDAFALVTGSRGRGRLTGMLLGSVSLAVAARAHCPVVVVRGDQAGLAGTHGRILLGIGDADTGTEALRFAFREAGARRCVLDAVRAWRHTAHDPSGDRAGEPAADARAATLLDAALNSPSAEYPRVDARRSALEGPASKVLLHRSAAADLVVVGAHHRTGHFGLQLGRVGHTLLHHSQCPVAIVPDRPQVSAS
ncbi:universal stress protein [Streptomyces naphthomycinicus]|uniref:universal stress protein n=1 Tax=Streptomyces naphthomycinicus TaxID=2872625 RepID=UPI001CEDF904|nr:universal stress protein [Streptomyces sp. TML10]